MADLKMVRAKALNDKELKRKRKILLGSKSGVLIATMLLGTVNIKTQMKKKQVLTVTASEFDHFLGEVIEGLVNLRDCYVEEVEQSDEDIEKRWQKFISKNKEAKPALQLAR